MAKTKQEILGLSFYPHECGSMIDCVTKNDALKAMSEYAQQECIEFAEWAAKYYGMGDSYWISLDDILAEEPISTSQLYQLFITSKNK